MSCEFEINRFALINLIEVYEKIYPKKKYKIVKKEAEKYIASEIENQFMLVPRE